jgi:hypothetical protein
VPSLPRQVRTNEAAVGRKTVAPNLEQGRSLLRELPSFQAAPAWGWTAKSEQA